PWRRPIRIFPMASQFFPAVFRFIATASSSARSASAATASIKTTSLAHPARTIFSRPKRSVPTNFSSEARAFLTPNSRATRDCKFRRLLVRKCSGWRAAREPLLDWGRPGRLYGLVSSYLVRKFCRKDFDLLDDGRSGEKLWSFRHQ